jgi:gliding motility-associated protein GldC
MKSSEIKFTIQLDKDNIPDKIFWEATDNPNGKKEQSKAIAISLWDAEQHSTMRIDLWEKDMPVDDMKLFYLETLGGMAENILKATGDQYISSQTNELIKKLLKHLDENK